MTDLNNNIAQIEVTIEEANEAINLAKALKRLEDNQDFKDVILKAYFEEDAQRLVLLKAAPQVQEPEMQARILKDMDAIGGLYQHFMKVRQLGMMAEGSIEAHEETRDELMEEDV